MANVQSLIDLEDGKLSDLETLELFSELITTGQCWSLQGSYGRAARDLIERGFITVEGVITLDAYNFLAETPETEES
jgi:hypothetical protein